jgi:hypothetical protein
VCGPCGDSLLPLGRGRLRKDILHVKSGKRALVGIQRLGGRRRGRTSKRHVHVGHRQVVHGNVQVACLRGRQDVVDNHVLVDGAVEFGQLFAEYLVVSRAEPVHTVVHSVL